MEVGGEGGEESGRGEGEKGLGRGYWVGEGEGEKEGYAENKEEEWHGGEKTVVQ